MTGTSVAEPRGYETIPNPKSCWVWLSSRGHLARARARGVCLQAVSDIKTLMRQAPRVIKGGEKNVRNLASGTQKRGFLEKIYYVDVTDLNGSLHWGKTLFWLLNYTPQRSNIESIGLERDIDSGITVDRCFPKEWQHQNVHCGLYVWATCMDQMGNDKAFSKSRTLLRSKTSRSSILITWNTYYRCFVSLSLSTNAGKNVSGTIKNKTGPIREGFKIGHGKRKDKRQSWGHQK